MPAYSVILTKLAVHIRKVEGITDEELRKAQTEVLRIAALDDPKTDPSLLRIKITRDVWHRQRIEGETFRTILYIDDTEREIVIEAIMRRDKNTYRRVYMIFKRWEP
jgi:hypothetical protein